MPPPPPSPASLFKDAIATFLQSANHALSVAEESHKDDVARALESERDLSRQLGELRQERDLALQEKFEAELAAERAKGDADGWKAAASKAEWTIDHQAETIALLRRESQQWKDQFMRVEEERCKLATRIDEMVAEQLHENRKAAYHKEPLTPRSQGPLSNGRRHSSSFSKREFSTAQGPGASSSSRSATSGYASDRSGPAHTSAPTSEHLSQPIEKPASRMTNATAGSSTRNPRRSQQSKQTSKSAPSTTRTSPKQVLIRRVHAVVEIPVKEEQMETDEALDDDTSRWKPSSSIEEPQPVQSQKPRPSARKPRDGEKRKQVRRRIVQDEEDDADDDDDYVESGVEGGGGGPYGDEEEDELMMGVEDDDSQVYGSERVVHANDAKTPPRRAQTQPSFSKHSGSSSKRRVGSPHPNSTTKKARKK